MSLSTVGCHMNEADTWVHLSSWETRGETDSVHILLENMCSIIYICRVCMLQLGYMVVYGCICCDCYLMLIFNIVNCNNAIALFQYEAGIIVTLHSDKTSYLFFNGIFRVDAHGCVDLFFYL